MIIRLRHCVYVMFSSFAAFFIRRFPVTGAWGTHPLLKPSALSLRCLGSSTSLQSSRWKVGDVVLAPRDRNRSELAKGKIIEERGSGWYVVALEEEELTIKCRSSSLTSIALTNSFSEERTPSMVQVATSAIGSIFDTSKPGVAPPPPTIVDLDALIHDRIHDPVTNEIDQLYLEHVANHMTYSHWVVFTDLHCAPATMSTCLAILDRVHQLACERDAAVMFLGDFWHHRGTIRVDCLNAVLRHFKNWTVPMVMIPGNHDQVTLGGEIHGLTPLENSYRVAARNDSTKSLPGPLIFSSPTKFGGGLFIPHIRSNAIMESVLQSKQATEATALFVHADVTGAYMNDMIVSLGGVPPSMFPSGKPIYSGHFHKPHVVQSRDRCIEYLGSPYQVSLSEAQQAKALVVLDARENWKCVERISMDIGRRHFRVNGLAEFLLVQPEHGGDAIDCALVAKPDDRVVVTVSRLLWNDVRWSMAAGENNALSSHSEKLRAAGIHVEIREMKEIQVDDEFPMNDVAGFPVEDVSLETTWKAFLEEERQRGTMSQTSSEELQRMGLRLLEDLEGDADASDMRRIQDNSDLELHSVTMEGFGPFLESTTYPLFDRGLVLVRGSNRDGGSDSNGSGKTSLAVSILWALTGNIDPRPLQDSKVSDVIHDTSKTARVTLRGKLNQKDFIITRTKTKSRGHLVFVYNGEDLTTQSVKETQDIVDETLAINPLVLSRTLFHGQHLMNGFLEATDAKFKDELSLVVPLSVWQSAATRARKESRDASKKVSELDGMISVRTDDLREAFDSLLREEEQERLAQNAFHEVQLLFENEMEHTCSSSIVDSKNITLDALRESLHQADLERKSLSHSLNQLTSERDAELGLLREGLTYLENTSEQEQDDLRTATREFDKSLSQTESVEKELKSLESTWGFDESKGFVEDFRLPERCPTCNQTLCDNSAHNNEALRRKLFDDWKATFDSYEQSRTEKQAKLSFVQDKESKCHDLNAQIVQRKKRINDREIHWTDILTSIDEQLKHANMNYERILIEMTEEATKVQFDANLQSLKAELNSREEILRFARLNLERVRLDIKRYEARLTDLRHERDNLSRTATIMNDLSQAFSHKGVQAFVLQNAVTSLEVSTQAFLSEMSDGAQRLEISLDSADGISRKAFVRGRNGLFVERPLSTLSGGQWRRCSLALDFGFAELVARRGHFRSSICILDEPLTHLDYSGRAEVGKLLRSFLRRREKTSSTHLSFSTVLIILQDLAAEELQESFDRIDEVIKKDGSSYVIVDGEVS